jgi:integrase
MAYELVRQGVIPAKLLGHHWVVPQAWFNACIGGLRFHDRRHYYATWLVDDDVPPNTVVRVMGHEKITTTLQLYTRRTDDESRIFDALTDEPG